MSGPVLIETGPLVALIDRREKHHAWAVAQAERFSPPFLTSEAVITEACFLVRHVAGGATAVLEFVIRGLLHIPFQLQSEAIAIERLMQRYINLPMSLADASLVRLSELQPTSTILTFDQHFMIYRKNRRELIQAILPSG
jgi:predicted nucleic acid-binding protein